MKKVTHKFGQHISCISSILFLSFPNLFSKINPKSLESRHKVDQECSLLEGCYNGSSSHLIKIGINICATLCMLYPVGIPRSSRRLFQFSHFNPSHPNKSNHPTNISESPALRLDFVWANFAWKAGTTILKSWGHR